MAKDNRITMPSGIGGLVRYFDEYTSKVRIKPGHVLAIIVAVIVIMLFLNANTQRLLGF